MRRLQKEREKEKRKKRKEKKRKEKKRKEKKRKRALQQKTQAHLAAMRTKTYGIKRKAKLEKLLFFSLTTDLAAMLYIIFDHIKFNLVLNILTASFEHQILFCYEYNCVKARAFSSLNAFYRIAS